MCLILYATTPEAAQALTGQMISEAWMSNPDGLGFAFRRSDDGRVDIRKGFMEPKKAIRALHRILAMRPVEVAVHWRFGTSGGITPTNCHPFAMDHGALIHNGVLSIPGAKSESDTRRAARLLAALTPGHVAEVLETWRNGSRLLFMAHKRKQTWRRGAWLKTTTPNLIASQGYSLPNLIERESEDRRMNAAWDYFLGRHGGTPADLPLTDDNGDVPIDPHEGKMRTPRAPMTELPEL